MVSEVIFVTTMPHSNATDWRDWETLFDPSGIDTVIASKRQSHHATVIHARVEILRN
jgi:hypothetical protein